MSRYSQSRGVKSKKRTRLKVECIYYVRHAAIKQPGICTVSPLGRARGTDIPNNRRETHHLEIECLRERSWEGEEFKTRVSAL